MKSSQIQVILDEPAKAYTNSDVISGKVVYVVEDRANIKDITVSLQGNAVTRNSTPNSNGGQRTKTETHNFFVLESTLFPDNKFQSLSEADDHTLTQGVYTFPFQFNFPAEGFTIGCLASGGFFHDSRYVRKDVEQNIYLPPSFVWEYLNKYAIIEYKVRAHVTKAAMLKFNLLNEHPVTFMPTKPYASFSIKHISSGGVIDAIDSVATEGVKFDKKKPSGFWSRLTHSGSLRFPMQMSVDFSPTNSVETVLGPSSRLVRVNTNLASYINLSLLCPISSESIEQLLRENMNDKESLSTPSITLRHIEIKLEWYLRFHAARDESQSQSYLLLDKDLDHEFEFGDFEGIEHLDLRLHFVHPKLSQLVKSNVSYRLPLHPEIFDCQIPGVAPSFLCCNIRTNYYLKITLRASMSPGFHNEKFRIELPIVVLSNTDILPSY